MSTIATLRRPDKHALYAIAETQVGHFTTAQAQEAGYSLPLLHRYLANGEITRIRRGIYKLVHFPATEHEELVVLWLWTQQNAIFSHETALALHDLSDVLPAITHMTVPSSWRKRRLRIPDGAVLYYKNIDEHDWLDTIPITSPFQSIHDCIDTYVAPNLIKQAITESASRGLISSKERSTLSRALRASQESQQ